MPPRSDGPPVATADASDETNATATGARGADTAVADGAPTPPGPAGAPGEGLTSVNATRYTLGALIGRGGMGEVHAARDRDIGREVAVKRLRAAAPSQAALARFVREARIQARLEHPAIVPVHDLGIGVDGRAFFVMKRLAGTTLAQLLARRGAEAVPRRRLLGAFVEVCLAIEFAHTRGVIHRDLKPANIVLGDFGEVYVLDWGIARVLDDRRAPGEVGADIDTLEPGADSAPPSGDAADADRPATPSRDWNPISAATSGSGSTETGAVLGTPGYMAPEQLRALGPVDARADIYALGCVLYEILAGVALHPRGPGAAASILGGADARPSRLEPEVAPELDLACVRATALAPADRWPTARALGDEIQRYLDGDRDLQRRGELAAAALAEGQAALARGDDEAARADAMRAAGRALALDPTSSAAAQLISRLMLEPPRVAPPEVVARLAAQDLAQTQLQGRLAAASYLSYLAFLPLFLIGGVTSWPTLAMIYGVIGLGAIHAVLIARQPRLTLAGVTAGLVVNAAILIAFGRILGPYLLVPAMSTAVMSAISTYPALVPRVPRTWLILSTAIWVPAALEAAGVWSATTTFADGAIVVRSPAIGVGPGTQVLLLMFGMLLLLATAMFSRRLMIGARAAQHQLELQAWQLRQLAPGV
jgi:serine/threonine-protein kinase